MREEHETVTLPPGLLNLITLLVRLEIQSAAFSNTRIFSANRFTTGIQVTSLYAGLSVAIPLAILSFLTFLNPIFNNIGFLSPANIKNNYSTVIISFNIYLNVGAELYSFSIYPSFKSICSDVLSGFTPI